MYTKKRFQTSYVNPATENSPDDSRSRARRPRRPRRPRPRDVTDAVAVLRPPVVDNAAVDGDLEAVVGVRGRIPGHLSEKGL